MIEKQADLGATVTCSFLSESDDLVDELLGALKATGWGNLKLKYEVSELHAEKKAQKSGANSNGDNATGAKSSGGSDAGALNYSLKAKWQEDEEETDLTITVNADDSAAAESELKAAAELVMSKLFMTESFRRVEKPTT